MQTQTLSERRYELTPSRKLEKWGDGPWVKEPDNVVFVAHGLQYSVLRHAEMGHLCGYVALPRNHPLYGLHYDDEIVGDVSVHGGMTYSGERFEGDPNDWWFGFDCAHAGDLSPGLASIGRRARSSPDPAIAQMWAELDEMERKASFRAWDTYCTVEYVVGQCASLAEQLQACGLRAAAYNSFTVCHGCKSYRVLLLVELRQGPRYLCGKCRHQLHREKSERFRREMMGSTLFLRQMRNATAKLKAGRTES